MHYVHDTPLHILQRIKIISKYYKKLLTWAVCATDDYKYVCRSLIQRTSLTNSVFLSLFFFFFSLWIVKYFKDIHYKDIWGNDGIE